MKRISSSSFFSQKLNPPLLHHCHPSLLHLFFVQILPIKPDQYRLRH
ncbi:hypothetical protein LINPERHAP1_LOCUS29411 [Linum perenne]